MSSGTMPSGIRLNENQYLDDISQVFRRHQIPFGDPADVDHFITDLETNTAFRSDIFSLCTAISHMAEADLSSEALLTLVLSALTHAPRLGDPLEIPEQVRVAFLAAHETWSNRHTPISSFGNVAQEDPAPAWKPSSTPFAAAATLSGRTPSSGSVSNTHGLSHALAPDTPIGSLTLGELKSYLQDIEQRVSRLQPFLDAVARSSAAEAPTQETHPLEKPSEAILPPASPTSDAPVRSPHFAPVHAPSTTFARAAVMVGTSDEHASRAVESAPSRRSRKLIAAAAALAVVAAGVTVAYTHFRSATLGEPVATAIEVSTPAPTSALPPAIAATHNRSIQPTAAIAAASKATPAHSREVAAVARATSAPDVHPISTAVPPASAVPSPGIVPVPTLLKQTSAAVSESHPAAMAPPSPPEPAPTRQLIEPFNQRVIAPPSATPEQQRTSVAAVVSPSVPTATSVPVTRKAADVSSVVAVPSPLMMKYALSSPAPTYPRMRRAVDTSVIVQATIGKDGKVVSARSVDGAVDIGAAAASAVQRWRFRPYLVDGSPVQVVTSIKFVFKASL